MLYEYRCGCGKIIEKITMLDVVEVECECGKKAKRIMSVVQLPRYPIKGVTVNGRQVA